jgi:hypothetical protein
MGHGYVRLRWLAGDPFPWRKRLLYPCRVTTAAVGIASALSPWFFRPGKRFSSFDLRFMGKKLDASISIMELRIFRLSP